VGLLVWALRENRRVLLEDLAQQIAELDLLLGVETVQAGGGSPDSVEQPEP
jgi:hypothetical protein